MSIRRRRATGLLFVAASVCAGAAWWLARCNHDAPSCDVAARSPVAAVTPADDRPHSAPERAVSRVAFESIEYEREPEPAPLPPVASTLAVRVCDEDDVPIEGASVEGILSGRRSEATTDATGRASLPIHRDGSTTLLVAASGFAKHESKVPTEMAKSSSVEVRLAPATSVLLRLVLASGVEPLSASVVVASQMVDERENASLLLRRELVAPCEVDVGGLHPGYTTISAAGRDFLRVEKTELLVLDERRVVELVLRRAEPTELTFMDATIGKPWPFVSFLAFVRPEGGGRRRSIGRYSADENGAAFVCREEGLELVVNADSRKPGWFSQTVVPPGEKRATIVGFSIGAVRYRVLRPEGERVLAATVETTDDDGEPIVFPSFADANGIHEIPQAIIGSPRRLRFTAPDGARSKMTGFSAAFEGKVYDVVVYPPVEIRGRVVDSNGAAVPDVRTRIRYVRSPGDAAQSHIARRSAEDAEVRTGLDGTFRATAARGDLYRLEIETNDGVFLRLVYSGPRFEIEGRMPTGRTTIATARTVSDAFIEVGDVVVGPLGEVEVRLTGVPKGERRTIALEGADAGAGGDHRFATCDSNGVVRFKNVVPGTYFVYEFMATPTMRFPVLDFSRSGPRVAVAFGAKETLELKSRAFYR